MAVQVLQVLCRGQEPKHNVQILLGFVSTRNYRWLCVAFVAVLVETPEFMILVVPKLKAT